MAQTSEYKKLRVEFNQYLRRVRGHAAAAKMFIESGDLSRAYDEAQNIQDAAYEAKDLLARLVK